MVVKDDHNILWIIVIILFCIVGITIYYNFNFIKSLYQDKVDEAPEITLNYISNKQLKVEKNILDEEAKKSINYLEFTVDGSYNAGGAINYNIYLSNKKINNDIKIYLTRLSKEGIEEPVIDNSTLYMNKYPELEQHLLLYQDEMNFTASSNNSVTYRLRAWTNFNEENNDLTLGINTKTLTNLEKCYVLEGTIITDYKCYKGNNYNMPVITDIVIPSKIGEVKISSIGKEAFYDDEKKQGYGLQKVVIQDGITISDGAFKDNELENVTLPNDLIFINDSTFQDNKITNVKIPETVTLIGNDAFNGNVLTNITIPRSVLVIKSNAFANNSLTEVNIIGKQSIEDFSSFDYSAFGFMMGYSTKNIEFKVK